MSEQRNDQQCMLCDSRIGPLNPDSLVWAFVITWGSLECQGVEEVADACVKCETFLDYYDDDPLDCGDEGQWDRDDIQGLPAAQAYLNSYGCGAFLCLVPEPFSAEPLLALRGSEDLAKFIALMDASNGSLTFLPERTAVQGSDCKGNIVLHVPLDAGLAEAFNEHLARERTTAGRGTPWGDDTVVLLVGLLVLRLGRQRKP